MLPKKTKATKKKRKEIKVEYTRTTSEANAFHWIPLADPIKSLYETLIYVLRTRGIPNIWFLLLVLFVFAKITQIHSSVKQAMSANLLHCVHWDSFSCRDLFNMHKSELQRMKVITVHFPARILHPVTREMIEQRIDSNGNKIDLHRAVLGFEAKFYQIVYFNLQ